MPKKLNNDRKFPGLNGLRPDLVALKRREALERQAEYDKLPLKIKLERLPRDGAKKQRAKLEVLIAAGNIMKVLVDSQEEQEVVPEESSPVRKMRAKDRRKIEKEE